MRRASALARLLPVILASGLFACKPLAKDDATGGRAATAQVFPRAERPVSKIVSTQFSNEADRDLQGEAAKVMELAGIAPGMSVADVGAGEGYYTVRLAEQVGPRGRVVAQDIDGDALRRLGARVEHERLDNVSIKPGEADDPRLPERSFDRILLIHMYHEVDEPYAFLWRMWPALKPGGKVVVVDMDRPTERHGIAPSLLTCELAAVGFRLEAIHRKPEIAGYFAQFVAEETRPEPDKIRPCRSKVAKGAPKDTGA
ncbi:MAG: SAM-dependent methyltransferase [Novosphingobium sp. 28-62-57]|uniref:class I SAM-dependent methyltransferase n=1 Tax=unclassified Novosphingobium TaxID=2644732 RepID=UPI000BC832AD|nr:MULTISPECIES: methyltransferase domain-containing protein [unclassified Novosphingobium]OYW48976.1 MAG: SAM-dependent methyltransferase [Novosphingobium sp. 12-62-10]OYZ09557.1 MAG: SAM-dependent methyltransferase [Novosphingobium sp. 28-62-57]